MQLNRKNVYRTENEFISDIRTLSKRKRLQYLWVNSNGKVAEINVVHYIYEKIKKWTISIFTDKYQDPTDRVFIGYRVLQTISEGISKEWVHRGQIEQISSLAARAGLCLPLDKLQKDSSTELQGKIQLLFRNILISTGYESSVLISKLNPLICEYGILHGKHLEKYSPNIVQISQIALAKLLPPPSPTVNDPPGLYKLGREKLAQRNYKEALEIFEQAANKGHIESILQTAQMYFSGTGVEENRFTAFSWYEKAANAGDPEGMYHTGYCYEQGEGVEKNEETAAHWYQLAADKSHPAAMNDVGWRYENVLGNEKEAFSCYLKAAEAENVDGMLNAARCYEEGIGIEKDQIQALNWKMRAAKTGLP